MSKRLEQAFHRRVYPNAHKHNKKSLTSLAIRKVQIKTKIWRSHYLSTKMAKKRQTIPSVAEDEGQSEYPNWWWRANWYNHFGQYLLTSHDPATPLTPAWTPKDTHKNVHRNIVQNRKNTHPANCPNAHQLQWTYFRAVKLRCMIP